MEHEVGALVPCVSSGGRTQKVVKNYVRRRRSSCDKKAHGKVRKIIDDRKRIPTSIQGVLGEINSHRAEAPTGAL